MNTASRQELFCIIFCRCPGLHCLVLENREIYVKRDKKAAYQLLSMILMAKFRRPSFLPAGKGLPCIHGARRQ